MSVITPQQLAAARKEREELFYRALNDHSELTRPTIKSIRRHKKKRRKSNG